MIDRSGASTFCTSCGRIRSPPLAMVPAMTAFSSAVSRTSRWPMPLWYSAPLSSPRFRHWSPCGPIHEATTGIGIVRSVSPMPYFAACPLILSAPSSAASCANAVLQDSWIAVAIVAFWPEPQELPAKLDRQRLLPSDGSHGSPVSTSMPGAAVSS
jgi:hypothetical protein